MSGWISWIVLVPLASVLGWPRSLLVEGSVPPEGAPAIGTLCWAPDELTVEQARHLQVSGARGRRAAMVVPVMLHANGSVRLGRVLTCVRSGETSLQLARAGAGEAGGGDVFDLPHCRVSLDALVLPMFRARDGMPLLGSDGAMIVEVIDGELASRSFAPSSGRCVFRGAAAVRYENDLSLACGAGELRLQSFASMFAGSDMMDLCLLFVASGRVRTEGVRFELALEPPLATRIQGRSLAAPGESHTDRIAIASDACGVVTRQLGERAPEAIDGGDVRIEVRARRTSLRLTIPAFSLLGPMRVEITPGGRVLLDLLAAPRSWNDGDTLRADFSLSVVPRGSVSDAMPAASAPSERPRLGDRGGGLEREPLFASRAVAAKAGPDDLAAGALSAIAEEAARSVGVFDHGDFRLGNGQFGNQEFDPLLGLTIDYVRQGRRSSLVLAGELARHWCAYDIIRGNFDADLRGMPWQHGDDHASQRFEVGHVFLAGPLRARVLLDDPVLDQAIDALLERLPDVCDEDRLFRNERSLGWGLCALVDLALVTGAPADAARVGALLERLETRQAPEGYFRLDAVMREEDRCWQANLWVTALTTFEALDQAYALTHDERALRLMRRLVAFFDREVTTYPSFSAPNRVFFRIRDGMRQGSSGHLRGANLALVAALFARGSERCLDTALARKAEALWARVALEDLGAARGPELAKLLRALPFRRR
jgi:hypothetical protein